MISINNLRVSYREKKNVINNLSLQMDNSLIHGIVGLNGSGKTTLLNVIFGLKGKDSGEIFFDKERILKKQIAYLPTENHFFSYITAREHLNLFKNKNFDIQRWNELFDLPLDKIIDSYSTGMKKKLALMTILKIDKPIMILDEPFNGLDIESSRILRSALLILKSKGKTIVVTSHILETLTNMCDYIHFLRKGEIKETIEKKDFADFEKRIFETIEHKNQETLNDLLR